MWTCTRVCFCFNSIISIVQARWDQSFTGTKSISPDQSLRESNSITAHLFTNQINSHLLSSSYCKQDTTQDETAALERQSHWFFSGVTHLFLTFHSACCFGSELVIKRKNYIFLAFAFLVGIYFLWRNLPTCKCQMWPLWWNCCVVTHTFGWWMLHSTKPVIW